MSRTVFIEKHIVWVYIYDSIVTYRGRTAVMKKYTGGKAFLR